jgi:hypothetical protein
MRYDYQARVRENYPHAEAVFSEPAQQVGRGAPTNPGGWRIRHAPGLGGIDLGSGGSEDEAWQNAWGKIEASLDCDPTAVDD